MISVTVRSNSEGSSGGSGNEANSDIYYVPFVRDSQNYVNAALVIKTTPTDTTIDYMCDWQFRNKAHSSTNALGSAERHAIFFMMLDQQTLGTSKFEITDTTLFPNAVTRNGVKTVNLIKKPNTAATNVRPLLMYYEDCTDYYVCGSPEWCADHGGCDYLNCVSLPGMPGHCYLALSICEGWWGDNRSGTSGGGYTGGGPGGAVESGSGGTGGGSGGGWTPPPACGGGPTENSSSTEKSNIRTNQVCDDSPGWTPVSDEPEPPFYWTYTGDDGTTFSDPVPGAEPPYDLMGGAATAAMYPKFNQMLKNIKSFVMDNPKVFNALQTWSQLSKQQIINALTYGQGPGIVVEDMTGRYAYFNKKNGLFLLHVSETDVLKLEHTQTEATKQAMAFLLAVAVLHETVHHGTAITNTSEGVMEFGDQFEVAAFNVIVNESNNSQVIINFKKHF